MRPRWERIATAQRKGEEMPPIDVYRIGELHFVKDGHHRVSVARELGYEVIDAYVTEVLTELGADRAIRLHDLALKSHERLFFERVPLPPEERARIKLSDEWRYAALAEAVEAWGFRAIQARGEPMTRAEVAEAWFHDEYVPVVEMLREADLIRRGTETEAYMRVAHLRYLILRTHDWDDEVIEAVRRELETPVVGRGHDGAAAAEGAEVAGKGRMSRRQGTCRRRPSRRACCCSPVRLRPSSGSNRVEPVGVHPDLGLLSLLHLALGVEARHDLAGLAGARHLAAAGVLGELAELCRLDGPGPLSTVKCAYSSDPMDSTTSIRARKVEPRCLTSSVTTAASSKFSGRMPAISCLPGHVAHGAHAPPAGAARRRRAA